MFHERRRPPPLPELSWTDYRWQPGEAETPSPRAARDSTSAQSRLLDLFLVALAVLLGLRLLLGTRRRRARLGVLLVLVVSAVLYARSGGRARR